MISAYILASSDLWITSLLSGGVPVVGAAVVAAVIRLRKNKVESDRNEDKKAEKERSDTAKRLDRMELFLIGRVAEGGMPKIDGFLDDFTALKDSHLALEKSVEKMAENQSAIGQNVQDLRGDVGKILDEWTPNGGGSSYDKLNRLDKGGSK